MSRDLGELLGQDETVVHSTRQHPFVLVRDTGVPLLIVFALATGVWYVGEAGWLDNDAGLWIGRALWVAIVALLLLCAWRVLAWVTERLYLTTSKVVYAHGILNRNVTSTPLVKVDEVVLRRPLLGRMLGFGGLEVENAAGGTEPLAGLEYLPRPVALYRMVTERARSQRMIKGGNHRDDDADGRVDAPRSDPGTSRDSGGWTAPGDSTTGGRITGVEDYTSKYIGEHVELWLYGGEPSQEGTLTAFCIVGDVQHVELNGHILVPLVNVAGLHCISRCDSPGEDHWPPTLGDDLDELDT